MALLFVSPTEPERLRNMADRVSMHPEDYGVDVMVHGLAHSIGLQRKTISDLVSSLGDGRLAEQVVKMRRLDQTLVVVEGPMRWTNEGELLLNGWGEKLDLQRWRRIQLTLLGAGVHVVTSTDLEDTAHWITVACRWADSHDHSTLKPVGKAMRGEWGERRLEHYQMSVLCTVPGIGPELAQRIIEEVGFPFRLENGHRLNEVKGLGPKKMKEIEVIFPTDKEMQ